MLHQCNLYKLSLKYNYFLFQNKYIHLNLMCVLLNMQLLYQLIMRYYLHYKQNMHQYQHNWILHICMYIMYHCHFSIVNNKTIYHHYLYLLVYELHKILFQDNKLITQLKTNNLIYIYHNQFEIMDYQLLNMHK